MEQQDLNLEENTEEQNTESTEVTETEGTEQPKPDLVDLDSVEKFRFGGREWTPKEFQGAYMMQSDYTRKTQALAEERKYYDNLSHDLASVRKDPALIEEFKKIYPEKFHSYLEYVSVPQKQLPIEVKKDGVNSDPVVMELKQKFDRLESDLNEKRMEAINVELDNTFKKLSEKYPLADEEAALARGQAYLDKGGKLTQDVWDKIWKSVHDRNTQLAEKHYKTKAEKQRSINSQGRDVGRGGSTPGAGPKMPRTIKEASSFALKELMGE